MTPTQSLPLLLLAGCLSADQAPMSQSEPGYDKDEMEAEKTAEAPAAAAPARKRAAEEAEGAAGRASAAPGFADESARQDLANDAPAGAKDEGAAAPQRAWFPETMLFQPAVVTDDQGIAEVPVRVPDRLTTWRVLALAHDRAGHLAGDTTSFLGTLPVYVDPVVPAFLTAGDALRLPVQVVNTTAAAWSGPVTVEVGGASTASFRGSVRVGAGSSTVLAVPLSAPRPGQLQIAVRLGDADAVTRTVEVRPRGMPVTQARQGSLAGPRSFELVGPADMDLDSARVRVVVNPGALALLRRELARAGSGGSVAADAHALLLAGTARALLQALGETLDDDQRQALRDLGLTASQRVLRHARAPDTVTAALLLPAAAAHPDNPVLARLADRLADQLATEQRPDGTFGGGSGWTVQRMLVATAEATAAVATVARDDDGQHRATRVRLAASAAFERHAAQLRDPYTAAVVLVSGAVDGQRATALRQLLRDALQTSADGGQVLPVPDDVVRPDGQAPTQAECTALAALALAGSDTPGDRELVADLAGSVLAQWSPSRGWGDGRADLWGTRAVTTLLRDPLPDEIVVTVQRDGLELRRGVLTGARRTELLVMEAPGADARGTHTWTVAADPAVPGLGFSFSLETRVPWPAPRDDAGLQAQVSLPAGLTVGHRATLSVDLAAPRGRALTLEQPLPAGVQVDERSLDTLVSAGRVSSWESEDGLLTLDVSASDGTASHLSFDVIPTLGGKLHADATRLSLSDQPALSVAVPGEVWGVGG